MIHIILHGLAHNYGTGELDIYLLDCKGREYEDYTEEPKVDGSVIPSLPHIRLVTLEANVEYGITVLRHLVEEMDRRKKLFRNFKDYREKEHLPRVLLFIDEFQVLFQADYKEAGEAQRLLNELLRQGRSTGTHVCACNTNIDWIGQAD